MVDHLRYHLGSQPDSFCYFFAPTTGEVLPLYLRRRNSHNVKDYDAVREGRPNGVDSSDWIYPSTRPMRPICPTASVFIFKFNLIGLGWLEYGFIQDYFN